MSKHTSAPTLADARISGGKTGTQETALVVAGLRTPKGASASVTLDSGFGDKPVLWLRVTPAHTDALGAQVDAQLSTSGKPLWRWNPRRMGWWAYVSADTLAWLSGLGLNTGMSAPAPKSAPKAKPQSDKPKAKSQASAPTQESKPKSKSKLSTRTQAQSPAPTQERTYEDILEDIAFYQQKLNALMLELVSQARK